MRTYKSPLQIAIPTNLSLTQLLHTTTTPPLPPSHLIASDSLTHRSLTLHTLRSRSGRLAKALSTHFQPADQARWAILLPNSGDYIELVHAILWTSSVVCSINHAIIATEIAHGLTVTRPSYCVAYGPVVEKLEQAIVLAEQTLRAQNVAWERPTVITIVERVEGYPHITDFLSPTSLETLPIPVYPDTRSRLATIHLSSGTTGAPKGVELTHYNFVANVKQLEAHDARQFHRGSRIVAFTPFATYWE